MDTKRLLALAGVSEDSKYARRLLSEEKDSNTVEAEFATFIVESNKQDIAFGTLIAAQDEAITLDEAQALIESFIVSLRTTGKGISLLDQGSDADANAKNKEAVIGSFEKLESDFASMKARLNTIA